MGKIRDNIEGCLHDKDVTPKKKYLKSKLKPSNPWHILGHGMEHINIDEQIANKLEDLTGTPASQWLALEKNYRKGE